MLPDERGPRRRSGGAGAERGRVHGSAEGPAEDVRGKPYFTVRGAIAGSAVRCYFGEREEIALAVAGKRIVSVDGILHRDPDGRRRGSAPCVRSP